MSRVPVPLTVTVRPVSLHQRARHLPHPPQRTVTRKAVPLAPRPQFTPPPLPPPRTQTRTPAPPVAAVTVQRAALMMSHQRRGKRNRTLSTLDQWTKNISVTRRGTENMLKQAG